jgi:hypothetical protein
MRDLLQAGAIFMLARDRARSGAVGEIAAERAEQHGIVGIVDEAGELFGDDGEEFAGEARIGVNQEPGSATVQASSTEVEIPSAAWKLLSSLTAMPL